jgi:hypothetical protein
VVTRLNPSTLTVQPPSLDEVFLDLYRDDIVPAQAAVRP